LYEDPSITGNGWCAVFPIGDYDSPSFQSGNKAYHSGGVRENSASSMEIYGHDCHARLNSHHVSHDVHVDSSGYGKYEEVGGHGFAGFERDTLSSLTVFTCSCALGYRKQSCDPTPCEACSGGGSDYTCPTRHWKNGNLCDGSPQTHDSQTCQNCANENWQHGGYQCPTGYYKTGTACDGTGEHDTQTCEI
jgi:hypothetical protein